MNHQDGQTQRPYWAMRMSDDAEKSGTGPCALSTDGGTEMSAR